MPFSDGACCCLRRFVDADGDVAITRTSTSNQCLMPDAYITFTPARDINIIDIGFFFTRLPTMINKFFRYIAAEVRRLRTTL